MASGLSILMVTGLPRSGTSWVGKMLEASGGVVYVNEPMNPQHPPGGSPGVLDVRVSHRYQYISDDAPPSWAEAFERLAALRFGYLAELRRNRSPYDLARMLKYAFAFEIGRRKDKRALLDDPYVLFSVPWLSRRFDAKTLIVVRDPVTYVGSRRFAGWKTPLRDLLDQPLLVRDLLGPHLSALEQAERSGDEVYRAAVFWSVTHAVIDRHHRYLPSTTIVRYEDLARDPLGGFSHAYDAMDLTWSSTARDTVRQATSTDRDRGRAHQWTWSSGFSKTAFRPMNSAATLESYRQRLSPQEIALVRKLTADVLERFPTST